MSDGIQQHIAGALGVVMMFGVPWYLKTHPSSGSSASTSASPSPAERHEFWNAYKRNFKNACMQSAPSAYCECGAQYAVDHLSVDELIRVDKNPNGSEAAALLHGVKSSCE
jgi:hypothetical protein